MDIYSIHNIENFLNPYLRYLKLLPNWLFPKPKSRNTFLLYHSVSKHRLGKKSHHFTLSLKKFRSQMEFLYENNYHVLSVQEPALSWLSPAYTEQILNGQIKPCSKEYLSITRTLKKVLL